ncbi:MAG: gamma-glutamyltransferase [Betaproteobacteria bacterium]
MLNPTYGTNGVAVAPHALAAQSALSVLRDGGNAIEAMVAAAATIAVVYPHMNSIGGDGFWLIVPPDAAPIGIDACGRAGNAASIERYERDGLKSIPMRGPMAANTVAGTLGGWIEALAIAQRMGGKASLPRLLDDAIGYAEDGIPVTKSQHLSTAAKLAELHEQPGFSRTYLIDGKAPRTGTRFQQPALSRTLRRLAQDGLDSFYRGALASELASALSTLGAPLTLQDLNEHRAAVVTPLHLKHSRGDVYNLPPPTQGLVSLLILGILDRLRFDAEELGSADRIHLTVEATKLAFGIRDQHIADAAEHRFDAQAALSETSLAQLAARVDAKVAAPWGNPTQPGDTVWMGVIDRTGLAVSFIQSVYHEFGTGVVVGDTGVVWQNRGASFSLDRNRLLALRPRKKPFHTLNPAAARLQDGRTMVYGTMGGDGQPQTQAAIFTRYAVLGENAQTAVTAPRWLLGRTWGKPSDTLKLEARFGADVTAALRTQGHVVESLGEFDESVGHAGIAVRDRQGLFEAAADPRSDGAAAAF